MKRSLLALAIMVTPVFADQSKIEAVIASQSGGTWTFNVTIRHADTGWDHYADGWSVSTPDGARLGFRELLHPHENEQPFTRSLSGVVVPDGVNEVIIRARDTVHGWAERTYTVKLR